MSLLDQCGDHKVVREEIVLKLSCRRQIGISIMIWVLFPWDQMMSFLHAFEK